MKIVMILLAIGRILLPAIASFEDLKAAQREGLSITLCSRRSALCFMEVA
jgi:hypothetical protein